MKKEGFGSMRTPHVAAGPAASAQALAPIKVVFDGTKLEFDVAPVRKDGRVLVPVRVIAERFGADVVWDEENKTVVINTGINNGAGGIEFQQGFFRPAYSSLPGEIKDWISYSRELPSAQERYYDGHRFVLVTEGMKPTGGYGVAVEKVEEGEGELVVTVNSSKPEEGQIVTQALTYPYDLIVAENTKLPLRFVDRADHDRYFMRLRGLETIDRPIVASSAWIKVFSPSPGEKIAGSFKLMGLANVFEGIVNYQLLTEKDEEIIDQGFTPATMLDWGYFEKEISIPAAANPGGLVLRLYSESAEDGSELFVVRIPLTVK